MFYLQSHLRYDVVIFLSFIGLCPYLLWSAKKENSCKRSCQHHHSMQGNKTFHIHFYSNKHITYEFNEHNHVSPPKF